MSEVTSSTKVGRVEGIERGVEMLKADKTGTYLATVLRYTTPDGKDTKKIITNQTFKYNPVLEQGLKNVREGDYIKVSQEKKTLPSGKFVWNVTEVSKSDADEFTAATEAANQPRGNFFKGSSGGSRPKSDFDAAGVQAGNVLKVAAATLGQTMDDVRARVFEILALSDELKEHIKSKTNSPAPAAKPAPKASAPKSTYEEQLEEWTAGTDGE